MSRLTVLGLLTVLALTRGSNLNWEDLRCTFSALDIFRLDSFFQLPRTQYAAIEKGWKEPGETAHERHLKTLCEKEDARICLLFDDKGTIAGYQIAIPRNVDSLRMPGMDFTQKGLTPAVLFGEQWYIARIFFVPQAYITGGGRAWDGLTGNGLWLPIGNKLVEIPLKESDISYKLPEFKKQNCYSKMGRHYFYNISRSMTQKDFQPFFVLYTVDGDLAGWGFNAFGSKAVKKSFSDYIPFVKKRNWFENVPSSKVRDVAPDTPDWALEYLDTYGSYSHHVYMVPKPWKINC